MKAVITAALLFVAALSTRPALAASHGPEAAAPTVSCTPARPLVHYLVATLHLPATRAWAVQQALAARPLRVRTPEQVAQRLATVLLPAEYAHLQALQADMGTYESLRTLASR